MRQVSKKDFDAIDRNDAQALDQAVELGKKAVEEGEARNAHTQEIAESINWGLDKVKKERDELTAEVQALSREVVSLKPSALMVDRVLSPAFVLSTGGVLVTAPIVLLLFWRWFKRTNFSYSVENEKRKYEERVAEFERAESAKWVGAVEREKQGRQRDIERHTESMKELVARHEEELRELKGKQSKMRTLTDEEIEVEKITAKHNEFIQGVRRMPLSHAEQTIMIEDAEKKMRMEVRKVYGFEELDVPS